MIDIHVHILPGFDDGAADIKMAMEMAAIAVDNGISHIIATPHILSGVYEHNPDEIKAAVEQLNTQLSDQKIPLKIYPGAEYYLEPDLSSRFAAGEIQTLNNSQYLLVELPAEHVPTYTEQVLYELQLQGITPIIAHPERNSGFINNPKLLGELIKRGSLGQITTGSIAGKFGQRAKKAAFLFLRNNWGHVIASDAHSSWGRVPELSSAAQGLNKMGGEKFSQGLLVHNPLNIIKGKPLLPIPVAHPVKSFFLFQRHK